MVHRLFEQQAERSPEAIAVTCGDQRLTYRELDERANGVALELAERGVGPEVLVGLCANRSPELVIGLLAILKAGGAYLPLDPDYPAERLQFMLDDAGASIVLVEPGLGERVPGREAETVEIGGRRESEPPASDVEPSNLAYVIYTSGSTGRPKGVQVEHRNVARLFAVTAGEFEFGSEDVWTLFHSFAFDFSVWEIWGALLYGGRLVIVPKEIARDPAGLLALLREEGVTVLNQTPSAFRELIAAEGRDREGAPSSLRLVIFGGEALDFSMLRPWFDRHPAERPRLVNMYGITETTVHVTLRPVSPEDLESPAKSPIGRPLDDLRVLVLDGSGQPVPPGVRGELYVGGAGVTRGYLNRTELTAERFVADPLTGDPNERLYKTGDVGRLLPDGTIDFLGRADDQVQIRGFRIEPAEIDGVLSQHPAVEQALTVAREDGALGPQLVSYVTLSGAGEPAELRDFARRSLPSHMVPAAIVPLESFPLTPNGKVDKKALPAPGLPASGATRTAPESPTAKRMGQLWEEVLGIEGIALEDNFFELGGHSLAAAQVASAASDLLDVVFPLGALFEHPTLGEFAALAERLAVGDEEGLERPQVLPRQSADEEDGLAIVQESRLKVDSDRRLKGSTMPVIMLYRLQGPLDVERLGDALDALAARHETLRSSFYLRDGRSYVRFASVEESSWPLEVIAAEGSSDEQADELLREALSRSFDVEKGPLARGVLVQRAEDSNLLGLAVEHLVFDGASVPILIRELSALYGGTEPPPPLPFQYGDFALTQRRWLEGPARERLLDYWRQHLRDESFAPALELPTEVAAGESMTGPLARTSLPIPAELLASLEEAASANGATLYMALLTAIVRAQRHYASRDRVGLVIPTENRTFTGSELLVGYFSNTLSVYVDVPADAGWQEVLERVREMVVGTVRHQDVPNAVLARELRPDMGKHRADVPTLYFDLQHETDERLPRFEGVVATELDPLGYESFKWHAGIDVLLRRDAGAPVLTTLYAEGIYAESTIQAFLGEILAYAEEMGAAACVR
jgi:amino acid adenylation domain-containing protein